MRAGSCQPEKCGAFCCSVLPSAHRFDKSSLAEGAVMWAGHGYTIEPAPNNRWFAYRRSRCVFLDDRNGCILHGKGKPRSCRNFPPENDTGFYELCRLHGCTYRFTKPKPQCPR